MGLPEAGRRSDADLIVASVADGAQFMQVFERHYHAIRRYLQSRAGVEAGEELASDTFVAAFELRRTYDRRYPSAKPWLFGIATNQLRHHIRRERIRLSAQAHLPVERGTSAESEADDRLEAALLASEVLKEIGSLSSGERDALLLYAIGELSYREISVALGIPLGTVQSRLNRARRRIREQVSRLEAIGEREGRE